MAKSIAPPRYRIRFLWAFSVLLLAVSLNGATEFDAYIENVASDIKARGTPVFDQANMLSAEKRLSLDRFLKNYHKNTGITVAVVTLPSMRGGQIDDFTNRLYQEIGIGQKGEDRGTLLMIAKTERKLRIETGYGVEDLLTDLEASDIINRVITPQFKLARFPQGVESGVASIIDQLTPGFRESYERGEYPRIYRKKGNPSPNEWFAVFFVVILLSFTLLTIFGRRSRNRGGWTVTGTDIYGGRGGFGGGGGFSGGGGGFGGFGGGMSGGGGASGGW